MKSKISKKKFNSGCLKTIAIFLGIIAIIFIIAWSFWNLPVNLTSTIIFIAVFIAILYFDKSILRNLTAKKFKNKHQTKKYDFLTELYKTLTYLSLLISWFSPLLRIVFSGLSIVFPLLSIIRYIRHNNEIHWSSGNKNELSSTTDTVLWSALLLMLWNIHNQSFTNTLWISMSIFSAAIIIPFFIFTAEYKKKWTVALGFVFCIIIFSYGAICNINRDYDFKNPERFPVSVVDKYTTGGRSTTLYVTVTPWKALKDNQDIEVDRDTYKSAEKGQKAYIIENNGFFGIEWHYLVLDK